MSATARIVLLNGVGSAGKSSIARALQTLTATPFLHVQMDVFLEMLPEVQRDSSECFSYETRHEAGKPVVVINTGPVEARLMRGMRHAIAAMARQGNDLIVDEVLLGDEKAEYRSLLSDFELFTVGVFAPLELLEARERQRGDRLIGLARWQVDRVHADMTYDLELDTSTATPLDCAQRIVQAFRL